MRIANIVHSTTVDGLGLRNALYMQGCPIHCKGCHNEELWDPNGGVEVNFQDVVDELTENGKVKKITILGGEPLAPWNRVDCMDLLVVLKQYYHCDIWLYSGYTFEQINKLGLERIFKYIDYLVEGPFIEEKKLLNGRFRGSSNQRFFKFTNGEAEEVEPF